MSSSLPSIRNLQAFSLSDSILILTGIMPYIFHGFIQVSLTNTVFSQYKMEVHLLRNPTLSVKEKALSIAYQPMLRLGIF
jgi:hypothetical protein